MDKATAIQLLTNLQHDYQSYADAFAAAIQALNGDIVIVDQNDQTTIANLQAEVDADTTTINTLQAEVPTDTSASPADPTPPTNGQTS